MPIVLLPEYISEVEFQDRIRQLNTMVHGHVISLYRRLA